MTSPILFAGGEDLDFGSLGAAIGGANITIDTTAGRFRSGYARYALSITTSSGSSANLIKLVGPSMGSIANFWFSSRVWGQGTTNANANNANSNLWDMRDAAGVIRLRLRNTNSGQNVVLTPGPYILEKVNAAGTATSLGTLSGGLSLGPSIPDKMDVQMTYGSSGSVNIWINGTSVLATGTVDTTTDSNTALDRIYLGIYASSAANPWTCSWSEIIVATRDTRNMSLATQAPTAAGNTATFTASLASHVNGNQANDTTPDYSNAAGQIDEYTVTPAIPSGNFSVISLVQHARAAVGAAGPQHMDFMVRTGGTDYVSSDLAPGAAWTLMTNNWDTNPNTGNQWLTSELAASSSAFNMGIKSVT